MTNEEAIKRIRDHMRVHNIGEPPHVYIEEALLRAIGALEKQIPMKPIYVDIRFRNHGRSIADSSSLCKCYKCPNCLSHIFHVFDSETHCKCCGQALDWSE